MTKRIFSSIFVASLTAVVLAAALMMLILYNLYESNATEELKTESGYLLKELKGVGKETDYFKGFYSNNRITFIAADGTVLYDNTTDAAEMENHSDRPEVEAALKDGEGKSRRFSDTLSEQIIYYAVRTDDGNVLRISKSQSSVLGLLWKTLPALILIILGVAVLSLLIAKYMTKFIIAPVNALNLDSPFENDIYDELSPLLLRIERQHEEIQRKMQEITEKQRAFAAVAENMREGLILLSGSGNILSINKSAVTIFGAEGIKTGDNILTLNRSEQLKSVCEEAGRGASTEAQLKIKDKYYQLLGSPVTSKEGTLGAVILILDITDKNSAERSRREFTANVSHELRTPLTSISGFAEIMKNGVAKPEDMQGFAGRIYNEANRLIALVDDIIRLSQLDEKAMVTDRERVDLLALADDVCSRLKPLADNMGVNLAVQGKHVIVSGYKQIIDEMIYNLCDNAIKYNAAGGSVDINIDDIGEKPVITVSDTGIGIPAEHQPYVFERFYRVDKGRSKQTGGTGLGLSIVKHGAAIHKADIKLDSTAGKGTRIDIIFPKQNQ